MATKKKTPTKPKPNQLEVEIGKDEDRTEQLARVKLNPKVRHAATTGFFTAHLFSETEQPSIEANLKALRKAIEKVEEGDKAFASGMLAAQALTLDTMFAELARRASMNMGQHLEAGDRYTRLALKAQANCRATLEALGKLHQPREQTVKHVHVNEGGQAVVADQFHQHQGEGKNEKTGEQSHATGAAGESPAMLGQDAQGDGVPIPGGEGAEKVQDARRDKSGST